MSVSALGVMGIAGVTTSLIASSSRADGEDALAQRAVSEGSASAERAIRELRRRGPAGHEALLRVHAGAIRELRTHPAPSEEPSDERSAEAARLRHAIDLVSGQRDGHASGLYWHTDLRAAQAEARRTGKPILSLRLLGRLDEELSCANSRYFRVVLYSDPHVAAHLRESYVLHWSSERPAPRITIDMGDGRRLVRTITGNSVHYVLDAEGRPVDAIVGLYAPTAFLSALDGAERAFARCRSFEGDERASCIASHHSSEEGTLRQRWLQVEERDASIGSYDQAIASLPGAIDELAPSAVVAMPFTISKMAIETPMLRMLEVQPRPEAPSTEPSWHRVGVLLHGAAPLAAETRNLLRLKTGRADVDEVARQLAENAIADGTRNEVLFRRRVHQWLAQPEVIALPFDAFNTRVYAELLGTPASDPWLGLRADDLYDGVEVIEGRGHD
jgi:hypothetical protein